MTTAGFNLSKFLHLLFFSFIGALALTTLAACGSNAVAVKKYDRIQTDSAAAMTLTITKVQRPWYAFRPLIVGRFKGAIPEHEKIPGLFFKSFSLTQNHNSFGGIYVWQSETDAKNWFNDAWFARTKKEYGEGTVEYFQILRIRRIAELSQPENSYWSALSMSETKIDLNATGLLQVIEVKEIGAKETNGQVDRGGTLTLWNTEADAKTYFEKNAAALTYFDTPVLIDKLKLSNNVPTTIAR
ncbi:MAG: hypothetical protein IAF08_15205 [Rhizobacter sp.]|nr:hypothetical protein [Chlorobiales bacterium]